MFNLKYILMDEAVGGDQGGGAVGEQGGGEQGAADGEQTSWSYAENMPGAGDRPEWFKDKYTSVEAQAKAYNDLESRFGSFTGSPDEYAAPEGYAMEGEAAIMAKTIEEIAKNSNMNQDTYNQILEGVTKNIEGYRESMQQEQMEAAIKSIPNFENRRSSLADTIQANLTTTQFDGLNSLMTTVEGFEAVEALANQLRGGVIPGQQQQQQVRSTSDVMQEMNQLSPNDHKGRNRLVEEMNKAGGGKGKLI